MKIFYIICFSAYCLASCNNKGEDAEKKTSLNKASLMEADRAFSAHCEEKGMKVAFIDYIDSNGVMLRPGMMPVVGADAIDFLIQQDDSGYSLSWQPSFADVAMSGELGYTYGIYALRFKEKDSVVYGNYTSIWKKQQDGKWKFVLDTGNEGLGEE